MRHRHPWRASMVSGGLPYFRRGQPPEPFGAGKFPVFAEEPSSSAIRMILGTYYASVASSPFPFPCVNAISRRMSEDATLRSTSPSRDTGRLRTPRVFNRQSKERFARERRLSLLAHLGRPASYPERLIVARLVAIEWELLRMDARIDAGEVLSGHALRARLAGENWLRLDLQALGLRPAADREPTVDELLAAIHGGKNR